jgi:hypothetical protein
MKETIIPVPPQSSHPSHQKKTYVPDSMETAYFKDMKIQRHRTFKVPTQKCRQARIVLHSINPRSHVSFLHETNAAQLGIKKGKTFVPKSMKSHVSGT